MKKIKHFIIGITVVIVLIINLVNCSNNPKTSEIKKEVVENEQFDDSKSLLDIMDSVAASIAAEQEIENSNDLSYHERSEDVIEYKLIKNHRHDLIKEVQPPKIKVVGHWGKGIITGRFTGNKTDTIWLEEYEYEIGNITYPMYMAKSNIPNFPEIEMYGRSSGTAYIINEGDLDRDGNDEWGWMIGNHLADTDLEYHIVRYNDNGYWEELVDENGNPYEFSGKERHSGIDFFTKGPKKGTITISHYYWPEEPGSQREVKDTIWKPIWNKIDIN